MVKFVIDVETRADRAARDVKKVEKGLKETETAASRLGTQLRRAFTGAAIAATAIAVGRLADQFTNAQNRLRVLIDEEEELVEVTEELFDISNRTRSSFASTAEVYSRVGLAAKDLGVEQEQLLEFTESLNQAVALSGASAVEAEAGLIQLSQGLASGALRGEELNSVLEQLPVVADVIAQSLGVTRGELRELGSEGKISAEVVLGAFAEAREELDERFGELIPTLGQSFTVLKNNILEAVGALDGATGASSAFSSLIILLANNIDVVAGGILAISAGLATVYVPAALSATAVTSALTATLGRLTTALAANPFGVAVAGLIAAGVAASRFADELIRAEEATLRATEAGEKFALTEFGRVGADIQRTTERLEGLNRLVQNELSQGNEVAESLANAVENTEEKLRRLTEEQDRLRMGSANTTVQTRNQQQAVDDLAASVQESIAAFEAENELLRLNSFEREIQRTLLKEIQDLERSAGQGISDADREELELAIRKNAELERRTDILDDILGPQQELEANLRILNELETENGEILDQNAISAEQYAKAIADIGGAVQETNTASAGFSDGLTNARERLTDVQGAAQNLTENGFGAAEDALVSFATTGKADFSEFVDQVLSDIARLLIRQGVLAAFGGGGAGAGAGLLGSLFGAQEGGVFEGGRVGIVGEDGPELIRTPPGGAEIIPAGETAAIMAGAAAQPSPVVNVGGPTITNMIVDDPEAVPAGIESPAGTQAVLNVIRKERRTVRGTIG